MLGRRPLALAAALAAMAVATIAGAAGAAGGAASRPAAAPTYKDVAPIFAAKCAACHVQGGIGAFPLTSAADAIKRAALIQAVVRSGAMPPWMPGKDSPAYIGQSKRVLTAQEKKTIDDWVKGGAKR